MDLTNPVYLLFQSVYEEGIYSFQNSLQWASLLFSQLARIVTHVCVYFFSTIFALTFNLICSSVLGGHSTPFSFVLNFQIYIVMIFPPSGTKYYFTASGTLVTYFTAECTFVTCFTAYYTLVTFHRLLLTRDISPRPAYSWHTSLSPTHSWHISRCPEYSWHISRCPAYSWHISPCPAYSWHISRCPPRSWHISPRPAHS
jgi:hypothetical protein